MSFDEKVGNLIENVRQYPLLYDKSLPDYSNNNKKSQIWAKIAGTVGYKGMNSK